MGDLATVHVFHRTSTAVCPHCGQSERPAPDVDEVAVLRAMAGDRVRLTPVERLEAVRRLTARGLSAREIGERLHITPRHVCRYRSRVRALGIAA